MGELSLVSQPSTTIWNAKTMAMASQNCSRLKTRVPDQRSSAMVTTTATTASTVYSGIGVRPRPQPAHDVEHAADRLVGQQPTDGDDDEEDELLERHAQRQVDASDVERVVGP